MQIGMQIGVADQLNSGNQQTILSDLQLAHHPTAKRIHHVIGMSHLADVNRAHLPANDIQRMKRRLTIACRIHVDQHTSPARLIRECGGLECCR